MRTEPAAQSEYMYTYMYMHVCVNYVRACTYIPRAECRHTTASAACRQWAAGRSRAARAWRRVAARCSSATDTWTCPRLAPRWSCASARHVTHTANDLNVRYHVTMSGRCTMWRIWYCLRSLLTSRLSTKKPIDRTVKDATTMNIQSMRCWLMFSVSLHSSKSYIS